MLVYFRIIMVLTLFNLKMKQLFSKGERKKDWKKDGEEERYPYRFLRVGRGWFLIFRHFLFGYLVVTYKRSLFSSSRRWQGFVPFYVFPTERDKRGAGLIHLSVNKLHAWILNESLVTYHVGKARKAQNCSISQSDKHKLEGVIISRHSCHFKLPITSTISKAQANYHCATTTMTTGIVF